MIVICYWDRSDMDGDMIIVKYAIGIEVVWWYDNCKIYYWDRSGIMFM